MRRNWLAYAALTAVAFSVPVAGTAQAASLAGHTMAGTAQAAHKAHKAARHRSRYQSFNQRAATYVKSLEGAPYVYGGTSPSGFDCSGLTQYVYRHLGKRIQRTAEEQFRQFRRISKARARGGDLVFFHVSSDPSSYVYHVGVYEGGNDMVAATTYGGGVEWQSFTWAGNTVTFGTITH
jgi:cell wall-associated NlpC family hydrolase